MITPRVRDVMTREVFAVEPGTSIETAVHLLTSKGISGAPVIDENQRPIGVVSLSDLVEAASHPGEPGEHDAKSVFYLVQMGYKIVYTTDEPSKEGPVESAMSRNVLTVEAAAPIVEAAQRMVELDVHRLIVIDEGRMVGIVSSLDLLRGLLIVAGAAPPARPSWMPPR